MWNRLAICLVVFASIAAPRLVAAFVSIQHFYDAVDVVEVRSETSCNSVTCNPHTALFLQGIRSGQTGASSATYDFGGDTEGAKHCERMAQMAMAKPGKYQFAIGSFSNNSNSFGQSTCRLVRLPL